MVHFFVVVCLPFNLDSFLSPYGSSNFTTLSLFSNRRDTCNGGKCSHYV